MAPVQVEGTPVSGMPIKVHAAYDPITAAECEVAEGFDTKAPLVAGASTQLIIQVRALYPPPCCSFCSLARVSTGFFHTSV